MHRIGKVATSKVAARKGMGVRVPLSPPRMKKIFLRSCVALFSVLVSIFILILIEFALRARYPDYLNELSTSEINYLNTFSSTLGWAQQKNYSHILEGHLVKINEKGLRGKEYPYEKQKNTFRVLMLGDSITFGFEVINAGVQGYGTDQELIFLQNEGLKYHPDLVVLNFCTENDFYDNSNPKSFYDNTYPKPYFKIENGQLVKHDENLKLNPFQKLLFTLTEKSILFSKILSILRINNIEFGSKLYRGNLITPNKHEVPINTDLTYRLIQEIRKKSEQNNAAFLLAVFPNKEDYGGKTDIFLNITNRVALQNISTIFINKDLQEKGFGSDKYDQISLDQVTHLTPLGHKLVAEIFYDYFSKLLWVPSPAPVK